MKTGKEEEDMEEEEPQEDNGPDCLFYGESSLLDAVEESRGVYGSTIYPRSLFEVCEIGQGPLCLSVFSS